MKPYKTCANSEDMNTLLNAKGLLIGLVAKINRRWVGVENLLKSNEFTDEQFDPLIDQDWASVKFITKHLQVERFQTADYLLIFLL